MARGGPGTSSEALVLRVIPFGESSQVVHLATPEHGLVAALAKGALRPGGEFEGGLMAFAQGTAWWTPPRPRASHEEDGLALLRRFRQRDAWRGLAQDLERYRAACYVLELLRLWMRPALPLPALYRAAVTALKALSAAPRGQVAAWVLWFEARALAAAGHRPALDACGGCGQALSGPLLFAPAAGGVTHARCAGAGSSRRLSATGLAALRRLYTQRLGEFVQTPPAPPAARALRALHDLWIPWTLERRPHAMEHLQRDEHEGSAGR
jgi:DNA repair protein RecO (recombination protein O)